ncbi:4'-phosphopantetheinyl transferase family protein [Aeromonas piscicola]
MVEVVKVSVSHSPNLTSTLMRLCPTLQQQLPECWLPAPHEIDGGGSVAISLERLDLALAGGDLAAIYPTVLARATRSRQLSFIGGRLCAERAAEALGWSNAVIERANEGAPIWPRGLRGSITHTNGLAYATAVKEDFYEGLGIDSEWQVSAKGLDCILEMCCSERERWIWMADGPDPLMATLIFSAKEAGYKAIHKIVGRFVNFTEFEVTELQWDKRALMLTPTERSGLDHVVGPLAVHFSVQNGERALIHTIVALHKNYELTCQSAFKND